MFSIAMLVIARGYWCPFAFSAMVNVFSALSLSSLDFSQTRGKKTSRFTLRQLRGRNRENRKGWLEHSTSQLGPCDCLFLVHFGATLHPKKTEFECLKSTDPRRVPAQKTAIKQQQASQSRVHQTVDAKLIQNILILFCLSTNGVHFSFAVFPHVSTIVLLHCTVFMKFCELSAAPLLSGVPWTVVLLLLKLGLGSLCSMSWDCRHVWRRTVCTRQIGHVKSMFNHLLHVGWGIAVKNIMISIMGMFALQMVMYTLHSWKFYPGIIWNDQTPGSKREKRATYRLVIKHGNGKSSSWMEVSS